MVPYAASLTLPPICSASLPHNVKARTATVDMRSHSSADSSSRHTALLRALAARGKSRKKGLDFENRMWHEDSWGLKGSSRDGDGQEEP